MNIRIKIKFIGAFIFIQYVLSGIIFAHAQTVQEIAKKSFNSTVLLVMEDANGQPMSLGSGFFVREGIIASNFHVIKGASRGYAKIIGQKKKYDIKCVAGIDQDRDLVLLKIAAPRLKTLPLADSADVEIGEPIYAVGNPQGLEGTFSQGIVSSIRTVGPDKLLQITAPISPGSSGGPVLNAEGKVIGVSVATFRGGQNLNFAIPSNYLKGLLEKPSETRPLASTKSSKKQRPVFANLGDKSSEGVVGQNFTYDQLLPWGGYSFSLVNKLREPVKQIYGLIVFYDIGGNPIDVAVIKYKGTIAGGLAKRITGNVDGSVEQLNNPTYDSSHIHQTPRRPKGKVDIRILDFSIVE